MSNLRLLDPVFGTDLDTALRRLFPAEREHGPLQMRIDVSERPDAYVVQADVPGVKKEDIHVQVEGNFVRIDAECRREKLEQDNAKVLRSERYAGTFSRSFTLAQDIDEARVQAKYADGVLSLELPKKGTPSSRRINVE